MINWYEIMKQRRKDVLHGAQEDMPDTSQVLQRMRYELAQFKLAQQPQQTRQQEAHRSDGYVPLLCGDTI